MKTYSGLCHTRVDVGPKARPNSVCRLGGLVLGLALFFTPAGARAALYELTLNPDDLQRVGAYDFYTWSRYVSWEVSQSVMAGAVNYNKVCTFDSTPNTIGMHLLDVEANNSYTYNLGIVLTAAFAGAEDIQKQNASGGGDSGRERPNDFGVGKTSALGITPPALPHTPETPAGSTPKTPHLIPEPGAVLYLLPALSILAWRRVWPGMN